ncbi:hypothetical protein HAX54_040077, partial [Datura stramonium]|nr:hypothetical protein [Datura stramonium]
SPKHWGAKRRLTGGSLIQFANRRSIVDGDTQFVDRYWKLTTLSPVGNWYTQSSATH